MNRRHLQIDDTIECHGKSVSIFEESDVSMPYSIKDGPPPKSPVTWAWCFTNSEDEKGDIETIYLGFPSKQSAIDDAFAYRQSMMEDVQ